MIIGIFGRMGQGKTLVMTYLLRQYYARGFDIYSNYAIGFKHTPIVFPLEVVEYMVGSDPKVFAFDELGGIFRVVESVLGSSAVKVFSSYVFMRSRKMNSVVMYTSQRSVGMALKDLRAVTDVVVIPKKVFTGGQEYIKYSSYESNGLNASGEFVLGRRIDKGVLDVRRVGKLYSTTEDPYLLKDPRWKRLVELTISGDKSKDARAEKNALINDLLGGGAFEWTKGRIRVREKD